MNKIIWLRIYGEEISSFFVEFFNSVECSILNGEKIASNVMHHEKKVKKAVKEAMK